VLSFSRAPPRPVLRLHARGVVLHREGCRPGLVLDLDVGQPRPGSCSLATSSLQRRAVRGGARQLGYGLAGGEVLVSAANGGLLVERLGVHIWL
jgi:hypothetical protein